MTDKKIVTDRNGKGPPEHLRPFFWYEDPILRKVFEEDLAYHPRAVSTSPAGFLEVFPLACQVKTRPSRIIAPIFMKK